MSAADVTWSWTYTPLIGGDPQITPDMPYPLFGMKTFYGAPAAPFDLIAIKSSLDSMQGTVSLTFNFLNTSDGGTGAVGVNASFYANIPGNPCGTAMCFTFPDGFNTPTFDVSLTDGATVETSFFGSSTNNAPGIFPQMEFTAPVPGPTLGTGIPGTFAGLGLAGFMLTRRRNEAIQV
jgi:hypothetical protein